MPTPDLHDHRALVHQILAESQILLEREENDTCPPMAELLTIATERVCNQNASRVSPHHAAWLEAEAASHVITAAGWRPTGVTDPALPRQLARLNQHTRAVRLRLLALAARITDPDRPATSRTVHIPTQRTTASPRPFTGNIPRPRQTGTCTCACNDGGFCGGCGHAGCGGKR